MSLQICELQTSEKPVLVGFETAASVSSSVERQIFAVNSICMRVDEISRYSTVVNSFRVLPSEGFCCLTVQRLYDNTTNKGTSRTET